jgi:glutamate synthase domain-containing protein 3
MVRCENLDSSRDSKFLWQQINNHHRATGSSVAAQILDNWNNAIRSFMIVSPIELGFEANLQARPSTFSGLHTDTISELIPTPKTSAAGEEIHG